MTSGRKVRTLIVDDSFFVRKLLRELLSSDDGIAVAGEARDGLEAVEEARRLKPDVITMDYRMPGLNGAEAAERILASVEPAPVILMISAYTREGAEETLRSLRAGAVDFIAKPSGEVSLDIKAISSEIIAKVKQLARAKVRRPRGPSPGAAAKARPRKDGAQVVVIGASTGGPPVIEDLLSRVPADLKAAFLVVQHMPPYFTATFAERLNRTSPFQVKEAEDGDVVRRGLALLAPGDFHMKIEKKRVGGGVERVIRLTKEPPVHELRPSIDVTMASAAENFPAPVIGVILTGMGADGSAGAAAIRRAGGRAIVQDPETAVLDSMPRSVMRAALADEILAPEGIVKRLVELCG